MKQTSFLDHLEFPWRGFLYEKKSVLDILETPRCQVLSKLLIVVYSGNVPDSCIYKFNNTLWRAPGENKTQQTSSRTNLYKT